VGASKPLRSMRETEEFTVSTSSALVSCAMAAVKEAPATRAVAEPPSKSCFRRLFMLPPRVSFFPRPCGLLSAECACGRKRRSMTTKVRFGSHQDGNRTHKDNYNQI